MARAAANKSYFNFIAGKHSDGSALAAPENTARILQNVDLSTSGRVARRLGLDFEEDFVLSSATFTNTQLRDLNVGFYEWLTVAEDGGRNFYIVRTGDTLFFYNQSGIVTSGTLLGTLDISPQSTDVSLSGKNDLQVSSGKGVLFVTGQHYEPFYITFDTVAETFSITPINVEIRDFDGVDDGLEIDERPTVLSDLHNYNLQNQGWRSSRASSVAFPSNADIESLGVKVNSDGDRVFSSTFMKSHSFGNGRAPRGHFVIDAFNPNRQEVSGIFGLPLDAILDRPKSSAFFAGRVWYGGVKGKIYFSQILDDLIKVGRCHQEQDPTAEDLNELLDTDGGVLNIPEVGVVHKLLAVGSSVLIMASNGIWQVSGGTDNFTANTTNVSKVSEVGIVNYKSVVTVGDTAFFWSEEGIFTLIPDQISGKLKEQSLSDNKINKDYNDIPAISRVAAQGNYDRVNKKIFWSYHDGLGNTATDLDAKYNSVLIYDVQLNAFYDYRIEDAGVTGYSSFMSGIIKGNARNEGSSTDFVVHVGDLVTVAGVNVVTTATFTGAAEVPSKVLTFALSGLDWKITFSEFVSRTFHDWFSQDSAGANYDSVVETNPETLGETTKDKQATYLFSYYDFKRDGFGELLTTARPDPREGFRVSQNVVEVLRKGQPFARTTQNVVEVLRQGQPDLRSSQNCIEIIRGL